MTVERDGDWAPDTPARRAWEFLFGTDRQLGLFNCEKPRSVHGETWKQKESQETRAELEALEAYGETQTGKILSDEDEILDGPEDNWGGW